MSDDYWTAFIPAMRLTRLGDRTNGDPELAAAWIGWQAARRLQQVYTHLKFEGPPLCDGCGKTIAEHTALMHCRPTADREAE